MRVIGRRVPRKERLADREASPRPAISTTLSTTTKRVSATRRQPTYRRVVATRTAGEKVMGTTATRAHRATTCSQVTEAKGGLCRTDKAVAVSSAASLGVAVTPFVARPEPPVSDTRTGVAATQDTGSTAPFRPSERETKTLTARSAIPTQKAGGKRAI